MPQLIHNLENMMRAFEICALISSDTLQSDLIQPRRHVDFPAISRGMLNDCIFRSLVLNNEGKRRGSKDGVIVASLFNVASASPLSFEMRTIASTYSRSTKLPVLDTFFNGSTRCTTEYSLSNCLITDTSTPTHTSYGCSAKIVEHLKTSQFRCSNRPSLTAIQRNSPHCNLMHTSLEIQRHTTLQIRAFTSSVTLQSELIQPPRNVKRSTTSSASPWNVSSVFSDCMSRSRILNFMNQALNEDFASIFEQCEWEVIGPEARWRLREHMQSEISEAIGGSTSMVQGSTSTVDPR
ncbi:hypothetical protein CSKR_100868 [Clonorchis sinensis]|uniref:Uncharacterized protein n=1 Tax=Clonorchis sinensis TaxID=79923 RepID=A0A419QG33_CLOSI|nr:hypothetical protein CSKR_100868 [Clonorchis sinensis]